MSTAHPDNGGIQVFSRTQTAEQIQAALSGQGYNDFESETYSTAAVKGEGDPGKTEDVVADSAAVADPSVDPAATPQKTSKPGKHERQLARARKESDELREANAKILREFEELKTALLVGRRQEPVTEQAPARLEVVPPREEKKAASEQETSVVPKRPTREDFIDAADPEVAYEDALVDWRIEARDIERKQRDAETAKTQNEERQRVAQQTAVQRFEGALAEAKQEYQDFDEVMKKQHFDKDNQPLPIVSNAMSHLARNRKLGAKILYWLGTHPEEANKIAVKTSITDPSDAWAVEEAMSEVRREFDRIEQELVKDPPKRSAAAPAKVEVDDDDFEDDDEDPDEQATDPNLSPVAADPAAGRKIVQPPSRGTVDTAPQAGVPATQQPVASKPEPVSRVGNRGHSVNRPIQALPPETVRTLTPEEYRRKRAAEGSAVAR